MARTKGSYSLAGTLEVLADAPADARLKVNTVADLTANGSFPYKYVGMIVSVASTQEAYMLIGSDPTVAENWEKQGSGSVDTSKLYSTEDSADSTIDNADYFPFYDTSATGKKKALWSTIKSALKTYFDGIYSTFSGNYSDLSGKPTIPSKTSDLTNDSGFISSASMSSLTDTNISNLSDKHTLKWDATSQKWINDASVSNLYALEDTSISNPVQGNVLMYDEVEDMWVNGNVSGSTIKSATLTAGNTTVTFTGMPISGDYVIDFYTSTGINYTAINVSGSTVSLSYPVQSDDVAVYCEIKGV